VPAPDPFFAEPSGPRTTAPEFYATPSNKVAMLPKDNKFFSEASLRAAVGKWYGGRAPAENPLPL